MSTTDFGVNDALAVKLWSKVLDSEALKATEIAPLIGDDAGSIIQRKSETSKGAGDQVTFGIRFQLNGDGFTENELAEGNGESLSIYSDKIIINELGHVVGVKSENTIDQQRVPFTLREEARDGLADWYAKRLSVSFFNQVCGYTPETRVKFTGLQGVTAPTTGRVIRQSSRASDDLLVSGDTFTLNLVDKAKEAAIVATPIIRPINVASKRQDYNAYLKGKYVMYLHPFQVTDLRTNTSSGQWLDITKAAMQGGEITNNPIYTGALGEYNGVILRQAFDVTQGVAAAGTPVTTVRRAVLLGAQAAVTAWGQRDSPTKYRWNEELFDHKRRLEVSAWSIWGMKKTVFNALDYGTIVVSTFAQAHT